MTELKKRDIYVKTPAWYYLSGGNKCGIGYEEIAWSQPREEQLIYGRQIIHNASYARTMSMSWSHIPFAVYHGGGKDAKFLPFKKHKADYDWVLGQNIGNGVTGDFRGPALFDKDTLPIIKKWTDFYKKHRSIINADIIHTVQAQASPQSPCRTIGIDALLHEKPDGQERGLLWLYNQTGQVQEGVFTVPVYYTGLTDLKSPPLPLKGSMGKKVKVYGDAPPNYDWLPQNEDYDTPKPSGRISGKVRITDENGNVSVLEADSNGNVFLAYRLGPMSFTHYFISEV